METTDARKLLDDAFEEIALVLGGIFTVHSVHDEAIWQIMKHLDIAHENALAKLDGMEGGTGRVGPARQSYAAHPAVEALLLKLKKRKPCPREEP